MRVWTPFILLGLLWVFDQGAWANQGPAASWGRWSERGVHIKVMATSVPVRTGPGGSFREIGRVGLGQVFQAIDSSTDGSWFRIRLTRGISGWVFSELVWPFELLNEGDSTSTARWPRSQLADTSLHLTILAGVLRTDGLFSLRLAFQPSRHFFYELSFNQASGDLGDMQLLGVEMMVAIGPWNAFVPFVAVGSGLAIAIPHRNVHLIDKELSPLLTAGGGLLVALGKSLTMRLDLRQNMVFSTEKMWSALSIVGGLMLTY